MEALHTSVRSLQVPRLPVLIFLLAERSKATLEYCYSTAKAIFQPFTVEFAGALLVLLRETVANGSLQKRRLGIVSIKSDKGSHRDTLWTTGSSSVETPLYVVVRSC